MEAQKDERLPAQEERAKATKLILSYRIQLKMALIEKWRNPILI